MSEDELSVQRCLNGEKDAFSILVDKYKAAVYGLAYRMVHNFHDAQDIGQEVFIDAYENLQSLKRPHRFGSWIYTITMNRCRMWLRKHGCDALAIVPVEASETKAKQRDQAIQQDHTRSILAPRRDAIDELPDSNQLDTILYYINGLTCKEIAEFTGASINTVMGKLRRARETLRKQFTEIPPLWVYKRNFACHRNPGANPSTALQPDRSNFVATLGCRTYCRADYHGYDALNPSEASS